MAAIAGGLADAEVCLYIVDVAYNDIHVLYSHW